VKVKILEIDSERRRLSLSIKRVEGQVLPRRSAADAGDLENVPELGLSEDVFAPPAEAPEIEDEAPEVEAETPEPEAAAEPEPAPDEEPEEST
jgi:small subunit ribosomal protein S1